MKGLIFIVLTAASISASAYTVNYGPGAYTKEITKCGYGRHDSSPNDCITTNDKFFAPRKETHCNSNHSGGKETCFDVMVTGNWGSRVFESRAEARKVLQEERGSK
jgi:hypothetical protein